MVGPFGGSLGGVTIVFGSVTKGYTSVPKGYTSVLPGVRGPIYYTYSIHFPDTLLYMRDK